MFDAQILSELTRIRECLERMEQDGKQARMQSSPQAATEQVQQILQAFGLDKMMQGDK